MKRCEALRETADAIMEYLLCIDGVAGCSLCGSLALGSADEYSDIDLIADVSGMDNSLFAFRLPAVIAKRFPVLYADFAPSMMPEKYIVSLALSEDNPFLIVDICSAASPHYTTLGRDDFPFDAVAHTLKVIAANTKHFLRGQDCRGDIERMYKRLFGEPGDISEMGMLRGVYHWLVGNAPGRYGRYIHRIGNVLV